ncbi:MAG: hypothetical protein SNJ69_15950 [Chloroflexaceae bacterium]
MMLNDCTSYNLHSTISPNRQRSPARAILSGLFVGGLFFLIGLQHLFEGPGDFNWALNTARALIAGEDPYAFEPSALLVPYPLPVVLFGLPLSGLPDHLAARLFFGISSGLLAYGIARSGEWWRLLIFITPTYLYAFMFAQWSPLIAASWFIPALAPLLVLVKPHIALPVALNRLNRWGLLLAAVVLLGSLLLYPTWPWRWLAMTGEYEFIIPVLTLPSGPLLFLALLRWRDDRARLLLGMSILPFRGTYDLTALWLVPGTGLQMMVLVILSWGMVLYDFAWFWNVRPTLAVPVLFVPALLMLLLPDLLRLVSARSRVVRSNTTTVSSHAHSDAQQ